MKKSVLALFLGMLFMTFSGQAHAQSEDAEVTDEQIMAYAQLMDTVDMMKLAIVDTIANMVSRNEDIEATRYNELNNQVRTVEDVEGLEEATDEEKAFLVAVIETKDEMVGAIKTVIQEKAVAMGEGGRVYQRVKKAISSDEAAKEKYATYKSELEAARTPEEEEEEMEEEG